MNRELAWKVASINGLMISENVAFVTGSESCGFKTVIEFYLFRNSSLKVSK